MTHPAVATAAAPASSGEANAPEETHCALVEEAVRVAVQTNHFVVAADAMAALLRARGADAIDLLHEFVGTTQKYAIPPTSRFYVGAAALGASGAVFLGVNVEFPGLPLNASVHAEQFALVTALRANETRLIAIATTAAPCGHCRQFMNELRHASELCCVIPEDAKAPGGRPGAKFARYALRELLPHSFGPLDLTHDVKLPLLLESRHNRLAFADDDDGGGGGGGATTSGGGGGGGGATGRERENAAAEALLATREACFAYAPYSHSPAGLALTTSSGGVYAGRSVESAAYNPSMSPLHVALVAATCGERYSEDGGGGGGGGDGGWGVTSATLAEVDGAAVSYEGWCRLMLGVIAPGVALTVVKLKREDVAA